MPGSRLFDRVCEELQGATSLTELEVRGTVRLALKQAGLDARSVTGSEMAVVLRKVLPRELEQRAMADAEARCAEIAERICDEHADAAAGSGSSVEAIFRRLGGSDS